MSHDHAQKLSPANDKDQSLEMKIPYLIISLPHGNRKNASSLSSIQSDWMVASIYVKWSLLVDD